MLPGIAVDCAQEYEDCAEGAARMFGQWVPTELLRALVRMPKHVWDDIDCNPHYWRERVNLYCLANSE